MNVLYSGQFNEMMSVMNLTDEDRVVLESLIRREGYDGSVSARARIVLWRAEGHSAPKIARMARTTKPTVYKWIARYEQYGVDGLSDRFSTGRPPEISAEVRARILAMTRAVTAREDWALSLVKSGDGSLSQTGDGNVRLTQFRGRVVA
jgi:Helix-turn-helix domain